MAAWACVQEFNEPSVCIVKHTNPCGVASSKDILESYKKAFQTDPTSAFGGVIACNNEIENSANKYKHCPPNSKESYYYRKIFDKYFPKHENLIQHFWLPNWSDVKDPSARELGEYKEN